jgi:hypothetical protein
MCNPFRTRPVLHEIVYNSINLRLKNGITILLLINFLVFQYARQLSYWECRLSNSFKTKNEKCDCEKMVTSIAGSPKSQGTPVTHNHFHVDESFFPAWIIEPASFYTQLPGRLMIKVFFIPALIPRSIDRPPGIS